MSNSWENLVGLLEKHNTDAAFIAECVYAYIVNYGLNHPSENPLLDELIGFIKEAELNG